jgi:agmatinase
MNDTTKPVIQGGGAVILVEQTFSHTGTFQRLPRSRDLAGVDDVFLGIPLDTASTFRPGARFGPSGIRQGSVQPWKNFPHGIDPRQHRKGVDYGDVWFDHGRPSTIVPAIETMAAEIIAQGCFLTGMGGDHFVSYPLIKAHAAKYGPLALIHFDAHPDTWSESEGQEVALDHGTMFARAVIEGLIVPEKSIQTGIRSWVDNTMGLEILGAPWVHEYGPKAVLQKIIERVGNHPAYLTVDIDVLDPAFAPGTGTPVCGGLSTAQLFAILRGLGPLNIVGMDIVEVAPAYDQAEITAIAGATVIYDQFVLRAIKSGAKSQMRAT